MPTVATMIRIATSVLKVKKTTVHDTWAFHLSIVSQRENCTLVVALDLKFSLGPDDVKKLFLNVSKLCGFGLNDDEKKALKYILFNNRHFAKT